MTGRMAGRIAAVFIGVGLFAACAHAGHGASTAPVELTVYAAASLTSSMDAVKTEYDTARPGVTLAVSTESSAALRTQIEQGAPADVFLSADVSNPERLVDAGAAIGPPTPFTGNTLAIIVPREQHLIASPVDLARSGVKIVAAGQDVPISGYVRDLLGMLATLPGYPTDFAAGYEANVVSREDNVRGIVAKIELGEGDAGIVYRTDALASDRVATIAIPAGSNVTATFAGVVVSASQHRDEAVRFLGWLAGPVGQALLARFGFVAPS